MLTKTQILQWFANANQIMREKRDELTELDTQIGDGDHGLNMQRGFEKALEKASSVADKDIGSILKNVGMTLLSQVGGASGPLYGTFFIKGAQAAAGKEVLSNEELLEVFNLGVAGIIARGRAELGDKTMCDLWLPVLAEMQAKVAEPTPEFLQAAVATAKDAVQATVPLVAKKGRASYLGERSAGHADPGATSSYYLLQALAQAVH